MLIMENAMKKTKNPNFTTSWPIWGPFSPFLGHRAPNMVKNLNFILYVNRSQIRCWLWIMQWTAPKIRGFPDLGQFWAHFPRFLGLGAPNMVKILTVKNSHHISIDHKFDAGYKLYKEKELKSPYLSDFCLLGQFSPFSGLGAPGPELRMIT